MRGQGTQHPIRLIDNSDGLATVIEHQRSSVLQTHSGSNCRCRRNQFQDRPRAAEFESVIVRLFAQPIGHGDAARGQSQVALRQYAQRKVTSHHTHTIRRLFRR